MLNHASVPLFFHRNCVSKFTIPYSIIVRLGDALWETDTNTLQISTLEQVHKIDTQLNSAMRRI